MRGIASGVILLERNNTESREKNTKHEILRAPDGGANAPSCQQRGPDEVMTERKLERAFNGHPTGSNGATTFPHRRSDPQWASDRPHKATRTSESHQMLYESTPYKSVLPTPTHVFERAKKMSCASAVTPTPMRSASASAFLQRRSEGG